MIRNVKITERKDSYLIEWECDEYENGIFYYEHDILFDKADLAGYLEDLGFEKFL